MEHASVTAALLASARAREAVLRGDAGTLIRLAREARGWRQSDLGDRAGYSQATISRLENGHGRITDVGVLTNLANLLGLPRCAVGLAPAEDGTEALPAGRNVEDVKRSEFLRGVLGAATALALPAVVADDVPGRVDQRTVRECRVALGRLYDLDNRLGGAAVYGITAHVVERMRNTLARASYHPESGAALHEIAAAAAEHAGWLSFDAGRPGPARRWWLEALHMADLGGARQVRITALVSMALQAADSPRPLDGREAVNLVQAARSTVGNDRVPRLSSLLAAREALGHARSGDRTAALHALATSERLLDTTPVDDEPAWLRFWNPADLACHQARVALFLGDIPSAEKAARTALACADEPAYPRNHALYSARLASVLARAGKLDESIAIATPVVARVNAFGSRRIRADLHDTVCVLDRQPYYPPAAEFTAWSRKFLAA
jgi:transcriptional regulator with XRE-family HTH domain